MMFDADFVLLKQKVKDLEKRIKELEGEVG